MSEASYRPTDDHRGRRRGLIALLGLVCLLGGWAIRSKLLAIGRLEDMDTRPFPQPKLNAPFIKTNDNVVDRMIELAGITDHDLVYDLGCGDGKIVIGACVQRGCRGIGFDIEPLRIAEAKRNAQEQKVDQLVTFKQADIFSVDLSPGNVIVMYLLPWMVQDLVPQFEKCRPGTRIVSEDWKIDGIREERTEVVVSDEGVPHHLFLYVTPLNKPAEQSNHSQRSKD